MVPRAGRRRARRRRDRVGPHGRLPLPAPLNVSVVIPLHNEEPNVERLLATVPSSLARNPLVGRFEVVCVDDGSTDRTGELLLRGRSDRLVVLSLPRRGGQSAALARGLAAARYDVIGLLDGDLQTSPEDFELLLPWLEHGFGCAHGIRKNRQDSFVRRASSRVARFVRQLVLGDDFLDISCPLTVFRKACLAGVPLFDPFHRYLPYLIQIQGYTVKQVPVRHFPRLAGRTKYGISNRLGPGLRSLLTVRRLARRVAPLALFLLAASRLDAQGASPFVPLDADVMPYVEHLIRAGVIRDPTPLTRPLRRGAVAAALARADTSRASAAVRSTVRDLAARLADRDVEPDFRGRFYAGPYLATHARRKPLREAGPRVTSFRAGMHLTASFGPVALSHHVIDAPVIRLDPDYSGRTDDSLPFPVYVTDAYASMQARYGELFLGTMPRNWGPTGVEGEMVSPEPYLNTHVMGRLGVDKLYVEGLYTQLDDFTLAGGTSVKRHWAAHRIFLRLFKWSTIVVTQGTLWYGQGRGPEVRWLNPLQLSEITRTNEDLPDSLNSLHGGQIYVTLPRRAVFQGALLIDDINYPLVSGSPKFAPDRIVGTAVLDYPVSPAVVLRGLFTGVTNLAYRSVLGLQESIMLHGVGLGRNFADYTQLTLSASVMPSPMLVMTPEFTLLNQGEGDFRIPFPNPARDSPLLYDGVLERTVRTAVGGRFQLGQRLDLMGDLGLHFITNRNHVAGNSATRFPGRVQLQYQLRVGIPLY